MKKRNWLILLLLSLSIFITGCGDVSLDQIEDSNNELELVEITDGPSTEEEEIINNYEDDDNLDEPEIDENGSYTSKEDVALYIKKFGRLPNNFISKKEARELGWDPKEGNLWDVAEGKSIGGDKFGNREGLLAKAENRQYYECDIDYDGNYRGAKRIVYSNDGLIYYTDDHYQSFELIYGDE